MTENLPTVQAKARTLRDYMQGDSIKSQLKVALPKWLDVERFLRIVFGATIRNPKLLDCTKESILQSVMTCAQLGLEPILGRAHLIPYQNSKQINGKWQKVYECQFQPGYQGLVDLARRSGQVIDLRARVVFENDQFDLDYGTETLTHKPHLFEDPGEPIGAYTKWKLVDGTIGFEFMPLHEIYKRRASSQSWQYAQANPKNTNAQKCPWIEWPAEMMKKTALKNHTKILPASIEFLEAVSIDTQADTIGPERQLQYGAPVITLPETTEPTAEDFDREFKAEIKNKKFAEFLELAREGNTAEGNPPLDDSALKILIMSDKRGPEVFRQAFESFIKTAKPEKKAQKKTAQGKGSAKKSSKSTTQAPPNSKKTKSKGENTENGPESEYLALQQSDEWQEMTRIFETAPGLYRKYNGKHVKTFDDASEFLRLVAADPENKDGIPGA